MPRIKSAKKRVQVGERNRQRNLSIRSTYRSALRAAREAIAGSDASSIAVKIGQAFSTIDKAVKNQVLHRNAAARLKSRLSLRLKKSQAAA